MSVPVAILLNIRVNCIWGFAFLVPHVLSDVDPILITPGRYLCYGVVSVMILVAWRVVSLAGMTRADRAMAFACALTGNVSYYALRVMAVQLGGVPIAALVSGTVAVVGNIVQRAFPFRILAPAMTPILVQNRLTRRVACSWRCRSRAVPRSRPMSPSRDHDSRWVARGDRDASRHNRHRSSANLHLHRTRGSKADHLTQDIRVRGLLRDCVQTGMPTIIVGAVIGRS